MAETPQHSQQPDLLGLQTFALSESAYDLVNRIKGAYARLRHAERQKPDADQALIGHWQQRSKEIGQAYRQLDSGDLIKVEEFLEAARAEWHQIKGLKVERNPAYAQ